MPLQGEIGSLCVLPVQIKYSYWHSTTGCKGSGLDSTAGKAAFHPITSQCWVLGVFMLTQLCHFYLWCLYHKSFQQLGYGRRLLYLLHVWVYGKLTIHDTWYILYSMCCKVGSVLPVTWYMTFSAGKTNSCRPLDVTYIQLWYALTAEVLLTNSSVIISSEKFKHHSFTSNGYFDGLVSFTSILGVGWFPVLFQFIWDTLWSLTFQLVTLKPSQQIKTGAKSQDYTWVINQWWHPWNETNNMWCYWFPRL